MKFEFAVTALLLSSTALNALDAGGVSIDFRNNLGLKMSTGQGQNLIQGGSLKNPDDIRFWKTNFWVHAASSEGPIQSFLDRVRPGIQSGWKDSSARLSTDRTTQEVRLKNGNPVSVSNRFEQTVPVPGPGKYILSFDAKGRIVPSKGSFSGLYVFNTFLDEGGKKIGEANQIMTLPPEFSRLSMAMQMPEGTAKTALRIVFYGAGEMSFRNVILEKSQRAELVTAKLMPMGLMDNLFCVPEKKAIPATFGLRNETGKKDGDPIFFLRLPAGFTVEAAQTGNHLEKVDEHTWKVDLKKLLPRIPATGYSSWGTSVNLLLCSSLPAGEKSYDALYWTEEAGKKSGVETFRLKVMPLAESRQPKRFQSGFCLMNDLNYSGNDVNILCDFLRTTGFNSVEYLPLQMAPSMKEIGFTVCGEPISNGYFIGTAPKPENAIFRDAAGKPYPNARAVCPVEIYRQGSYFTEKVILEWEKLLADGRLDNFMGNWEPYMFDDKGCFCSRCRDEFVRYSKLPPEEVKRLWGKPLLESRHYDTWVKFRSWQHGQLVLTIERTLNAIGKKHGKESHFIPMISYTAFVTPSLHRQYDLDDYAGEMKAIEPWGPYVYHRLSEPYQEYCGWNLITWIAAEKIRGKILRMAKDPANPPKLIAFPHSFQGQDWVTEPELIAFETLLFFVNRFEGSYAYFFPAGYDYRYWSALAAANGMIARHEETVLDGRDATGSVSLTPETPLPKPNLPLSTVSWNNYDGMPEAKTASMLQYRAFSHGENLLAAVGNFWKRGDAFYTLRVNGLDRKKEYAVFSSEDGIFYGRFSGGALADGILLHTGAVRWSFIRIEPFRKDRRYGRFFPPDAMRRAREERLPVIRRLWEQENNIVGSLFSVNNDYKKLSPVNNSGVRTSHVVQNGQDFIEVQTPRYMLLLDAENGGRLTGWKHGEKLLSAQIGRLGFGIDSFLIPKMRVFDGPWKLLGGEADQEGVKYTLMQKIPEQNEPVYGGLSMMKNITFLPDSVKIELTVENRSGVSRSFVCRSHNMPAMLTTAEGKSGKAASGTAFLERPRKLAVLGMTGKSPMPALAAIYPNYQLTKGGTSQLTLSGPDGKPALSGKFDPDALNAIAFWDDDQSSKYASLEVIYDSCVLPPGGKKTYRTVWTVQP